MPAQSGAVVSLKDVPASSSCSTSAMLPEHISELNSSCARAESKDGRARGRGERDACTRIGRPVSMRMRTGARVHPAAAAAAAAAALRPTHMPRAGPHRARRETSPKFQVPCDG